MRLINKLFIAIFAVLAATSVWLWHLLETEQQRSSDLSVRIAMLEQKLHTFENRPFTASAADVTAAPVPEPAAENQGDPPTETSPRDAPSRDAEVRDQLRNAAQRHSAMLRDPAYRKSQIDSGRRRFARTRADAIRVVGMTPEQADRVIDLWVERNLRFMESSAGLPGEPPSAAAQAEIKRALDAEQLELQELLGQEKYEQLGRFLATSQERAEVVQFRDQFAGTNDPLSDKQVDVLVDIIYSEQQRRSNEYEDYVKRMGITDRNVVTAQDRQRWLDLEKEANQRIHTAVTDTLSAKQLASLDEMLAARLAPVEAALRLQRQGSEQ